MRRRTAYPRSRVSGECRSLSGSLSTVSFTKDMFPGSFTLREGWRGRENRVRRRLAPVPGAHTRAPCQPPGPLPGKQATTLPLRAAHHRHQHRGREDAENLPPAKPHIPPPRPGTEGAPPPSRPAAGAAPALRHRAAAAAGPRAEEGAGGGLGRRAQGGARARARGEGPGRGGARGPPRSAPGPRRQRPRAPRPGVPAASLAAGGPRALPAPRAGCSRDRAAPGSASGGLAAKLAGPPGTREGGRSATATRAATAKETLSTPPETSPSACSPAWPFGATPVRRRCRPSPRRLRNASARRPALQRGRRGRRGPGSPLPHLRGSSLASPRVQESQMGSRMAGSPEHMAAPLTRHGWDPLSPRSH